MKFSVALIVFAALFAFAAADIWSNCGTAADHLKIDTVKITPDPPVKGQNITVTSSGTLDEQVTAGKIVLKVKFGFITVISKTIDLCTATTPSPCPIPAGPYSQSISELIPSSVPGGHYTGNVVVTDQSGSEIACIDLDFHI